MKKVKILFVCGNGVATSTAAAHRCKEQLEEHGIEVIDDECKVDAVEGVVSTFKPELIIPTTILPADICPDIQRFSGMPFMTGMNMATATEQLVEYINKL